MPCGRQQLQSPCCSVSLQDFSPPAGPPGITQAVSRAALPCPEGPPVTRREGFSSFPKTLDRGGKTSRASYQALSWRSAAGALMSLASAKAGGSMVPQAQQHRAPHPPTRSVHSPGQCCTPASAQRSFVFKGEDFWQLWPEQR